MNTTGSTSLGELLRRYRVAAGLTQEELAEQAGISVASISGIERGQPHLPRKGTIGLLAAALSLSPAERASLEEAARRRAPGPPPEPPHPVSLPAPLTPLLGREQEVASACGLLRRDSRAGPRLVTLTGPGGVGKTRLAVQVAENLATAFADGVFFVALAPLRDPNLVSSAIAQALELREEGDHSFAETLHRHLRDKQALLVLDSMEHLPEAVPLVADLLAACRRVKVLATSRVALHVRGEHEVAVPPLALPDPTRLPDSATLARYAAVDLFVQRVQAVKAGFQLNEANASTVAQICLRLDGLPLALELAAARVKLLPAPALLARLEHRLQVLTSGARDLPERLQTMRGAIAWSYDLLDPAEQALFGRLAVFVGSFTLQAAQRVAGDGDDGELAVLEGLGSLLDKSLLYGQETAQGEPRYGMLETIREFGVDCLALSGQAEALRERHAACYLALATEAEQGLLGPEQAAWLARLEADYDNLRAALQWLHDRGDAEQGLRLAAALWRFWSACGRLTEGRRWLDEWLALAERTGAPVDTLVRAKALSGLGSLASDQGDHRAAAARFEKSLTLWRQLGNKRGVAIVLNNLGNVAHELGDHSRAMDLYEESLALRRELGDQRGIAITLNNQGNAAAGQGDYIRAAELFEQSVRLRRELGDTQGIALTLHNLGSALREQGDHERAAALYGESLILLRSVRGSIDVAYCFEGLAAVLQARAHPQRAARLCGAAEALREAIGAPLPPSERASYEHTVTALRQALADDAFAAAWAAGRALSLDAAISEALLDCRPHQAAGLL